MSDTKDKPKVIEELELLIEQATKERSHYYVKSVCEKAILAIGMLMFRQQKLKEFASHRSKRSTYDWSDGPDYWPSDYVNEGQISCALAMLDVLDGRKPLAETEDKT